MDNNNHLKTENYYFDSASLTRFLSHDELIIHTDNRGEVCMNVTLINDEQHIDNYNRVITDNFSKYNTFMTSAYNILYKLKDDIVKFGYKDLYDPAVAKVLFKAVTIKLYTDKANQVWGQFDITR